MIQDTQFVPVRVPYHPALRILSSFPIACFCVALLTDLAYYATANMVWADFSAWLLAIGIILGVIAAIVGLIDLIRLYRRHLPRPAPGLLVGSLLVLIVAFFNNLMHSRDAWTSVVPWGIVLSAVTVFLILVTARLGAPIARVANPGAPGFGTPGLRTPNAAVPFDGVP